MSIRVFLDAKNICEIKIFCLHIDCLHSVWEFVCLSFIYICLCLYIFQIVYIIVGNCDTDSYRRDNTGSCNTDGMAEILQLHQRMIAIRSMLTQQ